jgi:hypothetical protein
MHGPNLCPYINPAKHNEMVHEALAALADCFHFTWSRSPLSDF